MRQELLLFWLLVAVTFWAMTTSLTTLSFIKWREAPGRHLAVSSRVQDWARLARPATNPVNSGKASWESRQLDRSPVMPDTAPPAAPPLADANGEP